MSLRSGRRPSVMKHEFSQVPKAEIQRSKFNRSHGHKTTFDAGYLVPFYCDEALPGDTFKLSVSAFARLATPLTPFMDNLFMDFQFFAVPYRLVWDNWQKFNGEQTDPGDSTDFTIPLMQSPAGGYEAGSLADHFGLPTAGQVEAGKWVLNSALQFRAYNLIYNEWYRDQNLQDSVPVPRGDGPDNQADYQLLRRGKRHDYFTSCLPWPQKGPGVSIPLGGSAPVITNSANPILTGGGGASPSSLSFLTSVGLTTTPNLPDGLVYFGSETGLMADLTAATAATINSLRQAFAVQRIYEKDARGGTRYTEIIKSHFGVTSPDARLQRPEYLGGGSFPVNITPVPQTSGTAGANGYTPTPQGNLAAVGSVNAGGIGFNQSFTEHCIILGIVSARADLTYQQGINKMWLRRTRFDFYWPALSHIGEQAVFNAEIYYDGNEVDDFSVFGYQERYAEYRYKPSLITGKFRSTDPQSLDIWHLAQDFGTRPALNSDFIEEKPPVDRVIATPDEPQFLFDSYINLFCARPMPVYGVPGYIDHF